MSQKFVRKQYFLSKYINFQIQTFQLKNFNYIPPLQSTLGLIPHMIFESIYINQLY